MTLRVYARLDGKARHVSQFITRAENMTDSTGSAVANKMTSNNRNTNRSSKRNQKRKYMSPRENSSSSNGKTAIPRGMPSILLSCDPTREHKCQREFLEILLHDWNATTTTTTSTCASGGSVPEGAVLEPQKPLTLDQELEQLKSQNDLETTTGKNISNGPFTVYDTGCKGSVLIVCTGAKPMVILPPRSQNLTNKNEELSDPPEVKRRKSTTADPLSSTGKLTASEETMENVTKNVAHDEEPSSEYSYHQNPATTTSSSSNTSTTPCKKITWNPVDAVERITAEMIKPTSTYPDSRFCSKITPLQTIVAADLNRIAMAVQQLIDQQFPPLQPSQEQPLSSNKTTFAIRIHRRLGSDHMTRNDIITKIAPIVPIHWKAQLTHPDIIIWIEIIKTLAGVSILLRPIPNLTQLRERRCNDSSGAGSRHTKS